MKSSIASCTTDPATNTILVVEDHPTLRDTLTNWLNQQYPALKMETASTGEEAVAKASRTRYRMILMDIRLPGISGIEAMKEIFKRGIETEVVVITNHDEAIYREEALNAGARNFVLKRNMWNTLPEIIESLLS